MYRFVWIVMALTALALPGGCSRTSDGSVALAEPYLAPTPVPGVKVLTFRRQRLEPPPTQTRFPTPPPESNPALAGPAPARTARTERQFTPVKVRGDVVCRNVTNAQGRVRVVCD